MKNTNTLTDNWRKICIRFSICGSLILDTLLIISLISTFIYLIYLTASKKINEVDIFLGFCNIWVYPFVITPWFSVIYSSHFGLQVAFAIIGTLGIIHTFNILWINSKSIRYKPFEQLTTKIKIIIIGGFLIVWLLITLIVMSGLTADQCVKVQFVPDGNFNEVLITKQNTLNMSFVTNSCDANYVKNCRRFTYENDNYCIIHECVLDAKNAVSLAYFCSFMSGIFTYPLYFQTYYMELKERNLTCNNFRSYMEGFLIFNVIISVIIWIYILYWVGYWTKILLLNLFIFIVDRINVYIQTDIQNMEKLSVV